MPASEMPSRPSSLSVKAAIRPAQPTRRKAKLLPGGDSASPASGAGLHDADQPVAG